MLGDKGYQGHPRMLTPFKNTTHYSDEAFNELLASARQIIECIFGRVKAFGALGSSGPWPCSREKHKLIFKLCCAITNIQLERDPVWVNINPLL